MMTDQETNLVTWSAELAEKLLAPLGNCWLHTQEVVRKTKYIGQMFKMGDCQVLIAAAYVHDIGYAPQIQKTAFHPLDGANYLLSLQQTRLASLVAHHSEAQFEAELRGLLPELHQIQREHSDLADALIYCDMHAGPMGHHLTFEQRIADILQRYPKGHIVDQAIRQALPSYILAIANIQNLLQNRNML